MVDFYLKLSLMDPTEKLFESDPIKFEWSRLCPSDENTVLLVLHEYVYGSRNIFSDSGEEGAQTNELNCPLITTTIRAAVEVEG